MSETRTPGVPDPEESYFTFDELIHSHTAELHGVINLPGDKELDAILNLTGRLLNPLRRLYGRPIRITSGYRCRALNRLVGGVADSQHVRGEAVDCVVPDGGKLLEILQDSGLPFDQAILYRGKKILHLSLKPTGKNRHQILLK